MKGKKIFSKTVADEIMILIKQKLKADTSGQKAIRNKIRKLGFYASDFGLGNGYTIQDFLRAVTITDEKMVVKRIPKRTVENPSITILKLSKQRKTSDEGYVIDLCDRILKLSAVRQHKFDFLLGDPSANGSCAKLPVDAYYASLKLVIEYRERQHTEPVRFFDRRTTVSGIGRGEQRKLYDERRRMVLPKNGIALIEISYSDFEHDNYKRIMRNESQDVERIKLKLNQYLPT